MANKWALNYTLDSTNNTWSAVWKLTRVMKAAGWNVKAHSDGTTKTAVGSNANDSWGNNADPMNDTFPAFTAAGWISMEGPKTLKLALSGAPSGVFVRGEGVVQDTTGATGELLGVVWDAGTASGWAVVMPRTGTFNGSNAVTGDNSGAGFTPSSIKVFTREVVFWKAASSIANGTCYYVCADESGESASLFSTLAASAGCTATVAPGGGGTGNTFPTIAISVRGVGGAATHAEWFFVNSAFTGFGNVIATNVETSAGVSADGTFWCMVGRGTPTGSHALFGFARLDDTEPGDVEPFAWYWRASLGVASYNRTSQTSYVSAVDVTWTEFANSVSGTTWKGYLARDCPQTARDIASYFFFTWRAASHNTFFPALNIGQPNPQRVANHPSASPPFLRDFAGLSTDSQHGSPTVRMHKGTIRWVQLTSNGGYKDTFDSLQWLCIFPYVNAGNPGIVIGPWDGSTTPS